MYVGVVDLCLYFVGERRVRFERRVQRERLWGEVHS